MAQSILEMAKDLVMAMIQAGALSVEDMHKELQKTYTNLLELKTKEEATISGELLTTPAAVLLDTSNGQEKVDWRKSIRKHTIECLECGATFKQLSVRHLKEHDLDARSYRTKYGIPRTHPLSAKDTTAVRKKIAQKSRPWEKAPTYMKSQQTATASAKGKRTAK
jgi:predicted transcriptional regulator